MKDRCAYICVYYFKFEVPDCRERLITTFKIIMSLVCDLKIIIQIVNRLMNYPFWERY